MENKTYKELQEQYTQVSLPTAWEYATCMEKKAELLVYKVLLECLENLEDVEITFKEGDPICNVIKSWIRNENNGFGKNAITLIPVDENEIINQYTLRCVYDIAKLTEDIEVINSDLFGTFDLSQIGEEIIDHDMVILGSELESISKGMQRKRILISNNKPNEK